MLRFWPAACSSALIVLAVLPQMIHAETRMPRLPEGQMTTALFGLAGLVATPVAILLLQGAVKEIGLA